MILRLAAAIVLLGAMVACLERDKAVEESANRSFVTAGRLEAETHPDGSDRKILTSRETDLKAAR